MVLFRVSEDDNNDLKTLIINNLETQETSNRNGRLYASDSGLCHKQSVLNSSATFTDYKDASFTFYVEHGSTAEKIIKQGLGNNLLFEEYELPNIGINLGGRVDGIILHKNKIWCAEIKNVGALPNKPQIQHESQAQIYSAVTGFPSLLIYVDRKIRSFNEPLLLKIFELNNDYDTRFNFLLKAVLASIFVKNKKIPNKPHYMFKSNCKYCNWYNNCWNYELLDLEYYDLTKWKTATTEEEAKFLEEAKNITTSVLSEVIVKNRQTGVLKFLETYGRPHVKSLLKDKDWSIFI